MENLTAVKQGGKRKSKLTRDLWANINFVNNEENYVSDFGGKRVIWHFRKCIFNSTDTTVCNKYDAEFVAIVNNGKIDLNPL
jgi:hypothetical protein